MNETEFFLSQVAEPYRRPGDLKPPNSCYITTAIDYPNALPHVGTAFEKIGADVQARTQRFLGRDVYFLMGNDENTAKVVKVVRESTPGDYRAFKGYVDGMAEQFKAIWDALDISYDDFIQTSEERHKLAVQKFLQTVYDAGYIYKKMYKSPYCEGCEEFKTAKSLVDGRCPNHPAVDIYEAEEENYFFRLSAFKRWVLDLYVPAFDTPYVDVAPESRLNEMKKFVESELEDISISRVNPGWGILCPFDDSQVVYVWFDALVNYLTGVGFGTDEAKFDKWWPADIHYIGKDITRFHCALWLAMIAAYNKKADKPINYPEQVFAHGFIYKKKGDELVKESKSGTSVTPMQMVEKYGSDAYRYYFLSKFSFGGDGEWSEEHFKEVYNGDLANNLGNLASRTCNMMLKYFDGAVPDAKIDAESPLAFDREDVVSWLRSTLKSDYRSALAGIWSDLMATNKYIDDMKPWTLMKNRGADGLPDRKKCAAVLRNVVGTLRRVAIQLKPYLPKTSKAIYNSFLFPVKWEDLNWTYLLELGEDNGKDIPNPVSLNARSLVRGEKVSEEIYALKYPVLFPRVE